MIISKLRFEHFVIAVLAAVLFLETCTGKTPVVATTTEITEKTVTTVDSATSEGIKNEVPEKIQIIETPESIVRVSDVSKLPVEDQNEVKKVNRYLDTLQLEGATIFSEILSEGRVLENNIIAEIRHKETIVTTTKTIIERPGGLFVSPGIDYSPLGGVEAVEASLTYIKENWGASVGAYYNFRKFPGIVMPENLPYVQFNDPGSLGIKLKIHIKL